MYEQQQEAEQYYLHYNELAMLTTHMNLLSDDIYAYALSKRLTKVSSPATVGLYSSCQDRLDVILDLMEGKWCGKSTRRLFLKEPLKAVTRFSLGWLGAMPMTGFPPQMICMFAVFMSPSPHLLC